jgi:hypothetical protein
MLVYADAKYIKESPNKKTDTYFIKEFVLWVGVFIAT